MQTRHFNTSYIVATLVLAIGLLAACAPAASTASYPLLAGAPAQAPTTAPTTAPAAAPAAAAVSLQVANNATLGSFLADGKGMTLYLFTKDTKNTSNCYDACATKWPPLLSQDKPTLGTGIKAELVGTTQRKDGNNQITFNGWPLYYYAPDKNPSDTAGQGVGSVWYVITPAGDAFTGGAAAAPNSAPAAPAGPALKLAENAKLGKFLADGKGMTLYLFTKDTKNTSNCYDACATKWPPMISQGKPSLGDGITPGLIGTTQRKDGSGQITYNGWPLYYYAPDKNPGDTAGQGVGSVWYVVTAAGDGFTGGAASANP